MFIIPRGRTGGTLLTTMLNAHPNISMGYEIYPDRLIDEKGEPYNINNLLEILKKTEHKDSEQWIKKLERNNFRTFCARARRSGLDMHDILIQVEYFASNNTALDLLDNRLDFIDGLLLQQAKKQNKEYVGSKMRVDPSILYKRHPRALQIMMLRDGRDVLDSRLNVGKFNTSPKDCAFDWVNSLREFEKFSKNSGALTELVCYEKLVEDPKLVISNILKKLNMPFSENILHFERYEQPLFQKPHGHLSHRQLKEGLKTDSVGRWKKNLTKEQLEEFIMIAGPTLKYYGYD
jgi:hypothetical protein